MVHFSFSLFVNFQFSRVSPSLSVASHRPHLSSVGPEVQHLQDDLLQVKRYTSRRSASFGPEVQRRQDDLLQVKRYTSRRSEIAGDVLPQHFVRCLFPPRLGAKKTTTAKFYVQFNSKVDKYKDKYQLAVHNFSLKKYT